MNLVANVENEPATGNVTAISPSAWTVQNKTPPMSKNAINREAGPPVLKADPDPINNPVPFQQLVNHQEVIY